MMQRQRSRLLRRQSSSHHHHQQPQQQQQRPSSISSIQRYVCHVVLPVIILYAWAWKQMMFRSTVDSAILLEPQTTTAMSLPSSSSPSLGFPRDPWIRHPDCRVVLKKDNVAARGLWCLRTVQEEDDKWLWPLMERLLEYTFRCKVSTDLLLNNDTTAVTSQKNCLFLDQEPLLQWDKLQSTTTTKAESFPIPNELHHLLPALWIPHIFQDYYWLPTASVGTAPFHRKPNHCRWNDREVEKDPFYREWLPKLRLCDTVTTSSTTLLLWASALGIPHRLMHNKDPSFYEHTILPTLQHFFPTKKLNDGFFQQTGTRSERNAMSLQMTERLINYNLFETTGTTKDAAPLRTLVIVMGSIRGGETAWQTLYENVLDTNQADLALVVGETTPAAKQASSLFQRAKYVYEFPEYNDWGDAVDLMVGNNTSMTPWRQDLVQHHDPKWGLWGGIQGAPGSGAVIFAIRYFVKQFLVQERLLERYDRFVLTRSDHYYGCPHDLTVLDPQYMWVPVGEDYLRGITDRHLVANQAQIMAALSIFDPLVRHPDKYASKSFASSVNPELLIKMRWQQEGLWEWVRRFPRVMFTCAVVGDSTRWTQHGNQSTPEGVFLKYPYEYEETRCVCGTGTCNIDQTKRRMRAGY